MDLTPTSNCRVYPAFIYAHTLDTYCTANLTPTINSSHFVIPVHTGSRQQCQRKKHVALPPGRGYLASVMASEYGFGSVRCPWVVSAARGQRINITLHNFARYHSQDSGAISDQFRPDACYEFAVLKEGNSKKNVVGCVGEDRQTHIYTSTGNSVELYVLDRIIATEAVQFLLEYNGKCLWHILARKYACIMFSCYSVRIGY